jgi:hypothetical protein
VCASDYVVVYQVIDTRLVESLQVSCGVKSKKHKQSYTSLLRYNQKIFIFLMNRAGTTLNFFKQTVAMDKMQTTQPIDREPSSKITINLEQEGTKDTNERNGGNSETTVFINESTGSIELPFFPSSQVRSCTPSTSRQTNRPSPCSKK